MAFVLAFTFFYALFYYGNSEFFGARHLFPVAPFLWLLVGRAFRWMPHRGGAGGRAWLDASHARAAGAFGVVALAFAASSGPWGQGCTRRTSTRTRARISGGCSPGMASTAPS